MPCVQSVVCWCDMLNNSNAQSYSWSCMQRTTMECRQCMQWWTRNICSTLQIKWLSTQTRCLHLQLQCTAGVSSGECSLLLGWGKFKGEQKVPLFLAEVTYHNIYLLVLTYQSTHYSPYRSSGQHSDLHTRSSLLQRVRMVAEEIWGCLQQTGPKDVHMIFLNLHFDFLILHRLQNSVLKFSLSFHSLFWTLNRLFWGSWTKHCLVRNPEQQTFSPLA